MVVHLIALKQFAIDLKNMNLIQPETIANSLFAKLESYISGGIAANDLDIRRLHREAETLMKVDPGPACIAKAGLAALEWNSAKARALVEEACSHDESMPTFVNASFTFRLLNDLQSAAEFGLRAVKLFPNTGTVISQTASYLIGMGEIEQAIDFLQQHQGKGLGLESVLSQTENIRLRTEELGVSEERLQNEIHAGLSVLTANKLRCNNLQWILGNDPDGEPSIAVALYFDGNLEQELALEAELAERLGEIPEWDPSVLSVELHYGEPNALLAA